MSKVTAIVSAYYCADFLEGRITNLLEQEAEIIVVCQVDSAEQKIAEKVLTGTYHICVITPDIPTIYRAWNLGIENATGDYITNANSDDRLYPGSLTKMAKVLDENKKYAVVYGNQDIVDEIGGDPIQRYEWMEGGIEELLNGCFLGPQPMWRKSLHEKHGLFDADMQVAGDYEFWLRLAKAGEKFFHLREVVGAYLLNLRGAEKRERVRTIWETARARARYRKGTKLWQN